MKNLKNGRHVDFWTLPHVLFGVLMGQAAAVFGTDIVWMLMGTVAVALLWEYFERLTNVPEDWSNGAIDIVLSVAGFGLAVWLLPALPHSMMPSLFWMTLGLWGVLVASGFLMGGWRSWMRL